MLPELCCRFIDVFGWFNAMDIEIFFFFLFCYFKSGSAHFLADIRFVGRQWFGCGIVDAAAVEEVGRQIERPRFQVHLHRQRRGVERSSWRRQLLGRANQSSRQGLLTRNDVGDVARSGQENRRGELIISLNILIEYTIFLKILLIKIVLIFIFK